MKHARQSGNALIIILVAVALFAGLGYAFTQNSRGNLGFIETEKTKANATSSAAYTQAVNMAVKRLKLRGCADAQISYETPKGNNANASAPADESCHIFRIAGGGVQYQGNDVPDPCLSGVAGTACGDGSIYVGTIGGNRLYAAASDSGSTSYNKGSYDPIGVGANSVSDGLTNTNTLIAAVDVGAPYLAAQLCRSLGASWYLPATDELLLLHDNQYEGALDGTINDSGIWYLTSTETTNQSARQVRMSDRSTGGVQKEVSRTVRCMRRD